MYALEIMHNWKKRWFPPKEELKKETREHTLVLFCFILYNQVRGDIINDSLILVKLDTDYCNNLRQFDLKAPYNYKEK